MSTNPYVGPRPFEEAERDRFFGRDEEIRILAGLVMSRRASLLFAQSGAGKSSLLRAGLIPELAGTRQPGGSDAPPGYARMRVLPIATVGGVFPGGSGAQVANPYVTSALLSLRPDAPAASLTGLSFADGLAPFLSEQQWTSHDVSGAAISDQPSATSISRPTDLPDTILLIFDQFEELFTRHMERWPEREDFFRQMAAALAAHDELHVLFSMREDYIAELVPYAGLLPEELRPRFRLERLRRAAALDAVKLPAARAGRAYGEGVAEALVDNLARTAGRRATTPAPPSAKAGEGRGAGSSPAAAGEGRGGGDVEPVHLQIVCRQLWERLPAGRTTILAEDVQAFGDVDQALTGFYESAVAAAAGQAGASERLLRGWFDEHLITPAHTRGLVYRGERETDGLPNPAVDVLNNAYVIRANMRGGDTWYELAHDRLIDPILNANRAWWAAYYNYNPLVAPARAWVTAVREPRLLLRGGQLEAARAFAGAHPADLTDEEAAFLAESTRQAREAARRRRTTIVLVAAAMIVLTALSAWALWSAYQAQASAAMAREQQRLAVQAAEAARRNLAEAQRQQRLAESRRLVSAAIEDLQIDPQQSIALALQALDQDHTPEAEDALSRAVQAARLLFNLPGHTGAVNDVTYSADGSRLATAGADGTVTIRDAAIGQELHSLGGAAGVMAWAVAFSPDGARLAAAYGDGTLKVCNAQTGELVVERHDHTDAANDVAFSPDGKWLATAGSDGVAIIYDAASGQPARRIMHDSADRLFAVAFSPDSKSLATAGADGTAQVWDVESGANVAFLQGHTDTVADVAWSPDGQQLATASWDGTAKIWDVATAVVVHTLDGHSNWVRGVAFSPEGKRLATTSWDRTAKIWDVLSGRELFTLYGHKGWLRGLAFSPDGQQLVTAGEDQVAKVWNVGSSGEFLTVSPHDGQPVTALDYSPDGSRLATAGRDGTVRVLDAATGATLLTASHRGPVRDVTYDDDGTLLASASDDRTAVVWDAASGEPLLVLDRFDVPAVSVSFGHGGTQLVTASTDKQVRLWQLAREVTGVRLSAEERLTLETQPSQVSNVVFSPDGTQIAASGADGNVKFWDSATGRLLPSLPAHSLEVYRVAYSPDGKRLATASVDQTAKVWDTASDQELQTLSGHTDRVQSVAFDPQGPQIATASWDRTARIWNAATGKLLRTLAGNTGKVLDVAFSPDGQRVATAGEDGTVRVYLLDYEKLVELARSRLATR
jgi:WD40 repeat protein